MTYPEAIVQAAQIAADAYRHNTDMQSATIITVVLLLLCGGAIAAYFISRFG